MSPIVASGSDRERSTPLISVPSAPAIGFTEVVSYDMVFPPPLSRVMRIALV
jgi:hypothetical protein